MENIHRSANGNFDTELVRNSTIKRPNLFHSYRALKFLQLQNWSLGFFQP